MRRLIPVLCVVCLGGPAVAQTTLYEQIKGAEAKARQSAPAIIVGTDTKPLPAKARPFVMTYRAVYEKVTLKRLGREDAVKLSVGLDEPGYERVDDAPPGVEKGLYLCWYESGGPKFEPVRKAVIALGKLLGRAAEVCLPGRA